MQLLSPPGDTSSNYLSTESEPANLQSSGQKTGLDYNLLMCHDITSLPIFYGLWGYILYNYLVYRVNHEKDNSQCSYVVY